MAPTPSESACWRLLSRSRRRECSTRHRNSKIYLTATCPRCDPASYSKMTRPRKRLPTRTAWSRGCRTERPRRSFRTRSTKQRPSRTSQRRHPMTNGASFTRTNTNGRRGSSESWSRSAPRSSRLRMSRWDRATNHPCRAPIRRVPDTPRYRILKGTRT